MKGNPVVRPATAEDINTYFPDMDKPTVRAWVGELDGRLLGIGGFALVKGRWYGFCDLTKEARPYKLKIVRTAKMIMNEARKQGIRYLYASLDENERGAKRWVESLGFVQDSRTLHLYRWGGK
jgi:hypothetical protein